MIRPALAVSVMLMAFAGTAVNGSDKIVVHHRPPEGTWDRRNEYFHELLELALEKTRADFGDFEVRPTDVPVSQERSFELLKQGAVIDVVWTMTTDEREREALPLRIPLLKGLLACRVLLIHESDLEKFANVDSLEDLRQLTGVQGMGWPDAGILEANGMKVIHSSDYDGMFHMLAARRIDFFPRSVVEVGAEHDSFRDLPLVIAPGIALSYNAPIYFFVSPGNDELHRRLSVGLERAAADGSFQALFESQPGYESAQRILAATPLVFHLVNPLLTRAEDAGRTTCMNATEH